MRVLSIYNRIVLNASKARLQLPILGLYISSLHSPLFQKDYLIRTKISLEEQTIRLK